MDILFVLHVIRDHLLLATKRCKLRKITNNRINETLKLFMCYVRFTEVTFLQANYFLSIIDMTLLTKYNRNSIYPAFHGKFPIFDKASSCHEFLSGALYFRIKIARIFDSSTINSPTFLFSQISALPSIITTMLGKARHGSN